MIDDRIKKGIYEVTNDSTLQDLKHIQDFLHRNFKEYEHYKTTTNQLSYMELQGHINSAK